MTKLTPDDILDTATYAAARAEHKARQREIKSHRRIDVGPVVSFYFENRATMWHQIQEMLYIEKGGAGQLADELEAYNPLVPEGRDLRCTMMIEIDDEQRRATMLTRLGWIDEKIVMTVGDREVPAEPLQDTERNTAEGKTSAVHFLIFRFDEALVAAFRDPAVRVGLEIRHENYGHAAAISGATRESLAADFS